MTIASFAVSGSGDTGVSFCESCVLGVCSAKRLGRVSLDASGIPKRVEHRRRHGQRQQDKSKPQAVGDRDAGLRRPNAGGKRIDRRCKRADERRDRDDRHRDHSVVAERDHQRDHHGVEAEGLVAPALNRTQYPKQHRQDCDQQWPTLAEPVGQVVDSEVERAGREHDCHEPADREDEQEDLDGAEHRSPVEGADLSGLGILDAVHAVHGREQQILKTAVKIKRRLRHI